MRSLTVTCLYNHNYGAVLQAYALHAFQKKLGIDNVLLNDNFCNKINSRKKNFNGYIIELINLFNLKKKKKLSDNFISFLNNYITVTREYFSYDDLLTDPPKADFYITGSDQVFTMRRITSRQRLLQFGDKKIKKYSYAASVREYDWNEKEKLYIKNILNSFESVSVREEYAKQYIQSFSDLNINVNIDPVFLLSEADWDKIIDSRIIKEDYILCYPVLGNNNLQKVIDELKVKTGLKVYCVQNFPVKRVKADKYIYDAGPSEFLNLIKYSRYVVTTSFHGTAFSVIFKKPFYAITKDNPFRIIDLLNMFNLSDRIYSENISVNANKPDFTVAKKVIGTEKQKSIDYFKKIISDVENN